MGDCWGCCIEVEEGRVFCGCLGEIGDRRCIIKLMMGFIVAYVQCLENVVEIIIY